MKTLWTLGLLLIAAPAFAQTGALVSYELQAYQGSVATATPFRTVTIPITPTLCNQPIFAASPPTLLVNPKHANWDDPANPTTRLCVADLSAFFGALPSGPYVTTVTTTDDFGLTSARSNLGGPFTARAVPSAPTGHQDRP